MITLLPIQTVAILRDLYSSLRNGVAIHCRPSTGGARYLHRIYVTFRILGYELVLLRISANIDGVEKATLLPSRTSAGVLTS